MERRWSRTILGFLDLFLPELAGLGNERACSSDMVGGITDCTWGTKVGDNWSVVSLWRISRIWLVGHRRLIDSTGCSRLGHSTPCLFTELGCFGCGSRYRTADRILGGSRALGGGGIVFIICS
jgi:hypothetical protein